MRKLDQVLAGTRMLLQGRQNRRLEERVEDCHASTRSLFAEGLAHAVDVIRDYIDETSSDGADGSGSSDADATGSVDTQDDASVSGAGHGRVGCRDAEASAGQCSDVGPRPLGAPSCEPPEGETSVPGPPG